MDNQTLRKICLTIAIIGICITAAWCLTSDAQLEPYANLLSNIIVAISFISVKN